jgi:hypothetical protein
LAHQTKYPAPQFNPITFLQTKKIWVIDQRENNGGIWAIGGEELRLTMELLLTRGFILNFIQAAFLNAMGASSMAGSLNHSRKVKICSRLCGPLHIFTL